MSDETVIRQVEERLARRRQYEGPDRREPAPYTLTDALKWLPLAALAFSAAVGYGTLTNKMDNIEKRMDKADKTHEAMWNRIVK